MSPSKAAVGRPTTTLILFVVVVALCIYSTFSLPLDLFPNIEIPYLLVSTTYENAGPEEIEQSVTRIIESAVTSVSGIKKVTSRSSTGSSMVILELNYGTNLDAASIELRDRIDMIRRALPEDSKAPLIMKMDPSMMPIMAFIVTGNRTPEELRQYSEDIIAPRLEQVDGIASVNVWGGRVKAINIEIPRDRLEAYSLTITQIAQMVGAQNVQASGGTITQGDINYTINTSGDFVSLDDIRNTVISYKTEMTTSPGVMPAVRTVRLRDIANVYEGYKEQTSLAFLNGRPGVQLSIQKQSGKNSVQTAEKSREKLAEIMKVLPSDVSIIEGFNTTDIIQNSIDQVTGSAVQGAALAVLVLFFFLRSVKSTLIIGLTIPISLFITLGILYFSGYTLNIMTLAGLALGVGMLVDNSIVILENIYSYRERGAKPTVAAVLGSQEMVLAISSSTLTTICVFLPLIMYQNELGVIGQIFNGLTFTVVFSLICSLVVALLLVPVLTSKYLKIEDVKNRNIRGPLGSLDRALGKMFDSMDETYSRAVRKVVRHRKKTVLIIFSTFVLSLALIPTLGFIYMPAQIADTVTLTIDAPLGTRLEVTEAIARKIETDMEKEINGYEFIAAVVGGGGMMGSSSPNQANVQVKLPKYKDRIDTEDDVKQKMRAHFDEFPGVKFTFSNTGPSMGSGGGGVDIIVKSDNLQMASAASQKIVQLLGTKGSEYVSEPKSDLDEGLPQVEIIIDREKMYNLGLNIYNVSREISASVNGATASKYRNSSSSGSGTDIDIDVILTKSDREKLSDLEQLFVTNSTGKRIPLSNFASYRENTAPVTINRENQTRTVHITATPVKGLSLADVQANVERLIAENLPVEEGLNISYGGDMQTLMENVQQFVVIIVMAVILVFAVMASLFESFLDPFIVLFTIPLSVVGIVLVYLIMGLQLNVITAVGVLVLVGIIVNNGIVLVDYTNLLRKRGLSLEEACVQAAKNRLRPILMTTLTTVLALIPMAFFPGEGSEMVQPIGLTVFGGLTFGTLMTLFLMPTLYFIFNNMRDKRRAKKETKRVQRLQRHAMQGESR